MKHKGIRPSGQLTIVESEMKRGRKLYHEELPEGGYRIWNDRLLKSGCGRTIIYAQQDGELIYCPYCDEWANENQFK